MSGEGRPLSPALLAAPLLGIALFGCVGAEGPAPFACVARTVDRGAPEVVPGSLSVRFKDSVTTDREAVETIGRYDYTISEFIVRAPAYLVTVSVPEGSECDAAKALGADPDVESAAPRLPIGG